MANKSTFYNKKIKIVRVKKYRKNPNETLGLKRMPGT